MPLAQHDTDLWSVPHVFPWQAGLVPIPLRMTVIRLGDGQLILHSPIPVSAELRGELEALGPVGFIVVPWAHGRYAAEVSEIFPTARLLAAPEPPSRRKALAFDAALADDPPESWAGEVDSLLLCGFRLNEVLVLHRPSRSLILTDLCFNIHHATSLFARLAFEANGMWRCFGPSRLIRRLAVSNRKALRSSIERVLQQWDFDRIVPAHGDVIEHGGPEALRTAWLG